MITEHHLAVFPELFSIENKSKASKRFHGQVTLDHEVLDQPSKNLSWCAVVNHKKQVSFHAEPCTWCPKIFVLLFFRKKKILWYFKGGLVTLVHTTCLFKFWTRKWWNIWGYLHLGIFKSKWLTRDWIKHLIIF